MAWQYYHTVWAVMLFGWVTNYMVRMGMAPVLLPIMKEFNLTHAQGGLLTTAFFYAYLFMALPSGHLGDRFGRKLILVAASFWWGISSLFTGFARSFSVLFTWRFMTGVGEGSFFTNDRPVIVAYTPREKMGLGQGISFTGLGIGMALGILLAGYISDSLGWRYVFVLYSIPSVLASVLIYIMVREPARAGTVGGHSKVPYGLIFKSRDLWLFYLMGVTAHYCLWLLGSWAPAMFKEIGVGELTRASVFSSLLGIAAVPGLIATGIVSDRLVRHGKGRKVVIAAEFLALAIVMWLIGYAVEVRATPATLSILVFLAGFFVWGIWAPIWALLPEVVPREILGTTYGMTNTIHFTGSLLAPPITGWIKDVTGSFSGGAYLAGGVIFVGALIVMAIRPAYRIGPEVPVTAAR